MTEQDPVRAITTMAGGFGWTPEDLARAAAALRGEVPTLDQALARIEQRTGRAVGKSYRRGMQILRTGLPAEHDLPAVTAFGHRSVLDFLADEVAANIERVQALTAAAKLAGGGIYASRDPKVHGWGTATEYFTAARAVGKALASPGGPLSRDPMAHLSMPRRKRTRSRESGLSQAELCRYLTVLLTLNPDPALVAVCWLLFRITGARMDELIGTELTGADTDGGWVTLARKGAEAGRMPVTRPVLDLAVRLAGQRPGRDETALLRGRRGIRVTKHFFEAWSSLLHAHAAFAAGHQLRVHALRHTSAEHVNRLVGTAHAEAFLNHAPTTALGTTGVYVLRPEQMRLQVARTCFGYPDDWPTGLPEWPVLAAFLQVPDLANPNRGTPAPDVSPAESQAAPAGPESKEDA